MSSIECEICPKSFSKRFSYKRHLSTVHRLSEEDAQAYLDRAGNNPTFQCPNCEFVGSVNHKALHMQSCKGKEHETQSSLVNSSNEGTKNEVPKLATTCKYCKRSYSTKYKLRDHCKNVHNVDINLEEYTGPKKEKTSKAPGASHATGSGGPRATATSAKAREITHYPAKVTKRSFRNSKDMADPFLYWLIQNGFAKHTVSAYISALEKLLDHFDQDIFCVSSFEICFQQFEAYFSQLKNSKQRNTIFKGIFQVRKFLKEMFDFQLEIPPIPSMANVIASYFSSKDRKLGYERLSQSQIGQIQAYSESQCIQCHNFVLSEVLLFSNSEDFVKSFTKLDFQKISNQASNHLFKFGSSGFDFPDSLYDIMKVYAVIVRPKLLSGKWSPNDEHKFFSLVYHNNLVFCSIEGALKCIEEMSGHPFSLQLPNLLQVNYSFIPIEKVDEEPLDMSLDPETFPDGAGNTSFADMEVADSQATTEVEAEQGKSTNEGRKRDSGSRAKSKKVKVYKTSTGKPIEQYMFMFRPQDHKILTAALEEFKKCLRKKASKLLVKTYFVCHDTKENKEFLEDKKQVSGLEQEELYEVICHYINKNLV